jgi:hypothetical protein
MNLSHNDANLQQSLVTSFATLPLLVAACVSCDNNELRDHVVYSPMTKLMLQHVKPILNDIHDVSKHVHFALLARRMSWNSYPLLTH